MKGIFYIFFSFFIYSVDILYAFSDTSGFVSLPSDKRRSVFNDSSLPNYDISHYKVIHPPVTTVGTIRRVDGIQDVKVVALTFDLCELSTTTTGYDAKIVNFLRLNKIPATFFLGGKWMRSHPERAMQLIADPLFEIGNHAWTHGNFGIMSESKIKEQVLWTQEQYKILRENIIKHADLKKSNASGIPEDIKLFRLPYGRCTTQALTILAGLGLDVIQWDVVAEGRSDNSLPGLEQDIVNKVKSGSIILFHANCVPVGSAALFQRTVEALKQQGYQFVTVGTLLTMGKPRYVMEGYFLVPGDNLYLDTKYGIDGTGLHK